MTEEEKFIKIQIQNAITVGRIAMRVAVDERDWLQQAIRQGRIDVDRHRRK